MTNTMVPATGMCLVSAVKLPTKWPHRVCSLLFLIACGCAIARGDAKGGTLFLLAGTPTNHAPATYPVNLYTVDSHQRLKLLREVVSAQNGLHLVQDDMGDKIYVSYPHIWPTTVSVIHKEKPRLNDEVTFNPGGILVWIEETTLAAGEGLETYALFPVVPPVSPDQSPSKSLFLRGASLVSIMGDAPAKGLRVRSDDWSEYQRLRHDGASGGPETGPGPRAVVANGHLVVELGGKQIVIDSAPASFPREDNMRAVGILAADERFLVFCRLHEDDDRFGPTLVYVHDRKANEWKELKFSASAPYPRIFGSWLATIVKMWRGPGRDTNPGHENERNSWTPFLLPNVRAYYATFDGNFYIPGALILDNLEDGRRITLQTNQEDSEIVAVRSDGLVLYRVNDSIFSAQVEGDKLSATTLVVKDDDVPEVHWAFWSPALASVNPPKPPAPVR